ncbi:ATPase family AAA domain-containing protein 5-like protein [Lates japonicus]|uniref:ATPase family AAA domain-containing protein 5-like protein n=1 Tax=Lates japonicus TaxID=270547 RepID=A0AAD3N6Q7_LATJO|nr:ATPase family AAA domain-containing protein 5-like protein [Lates japonicus]
MNGSKAPKSKCLRTFEDFFIMRNKLKRSKNLKDTACQRKDQTQPTEEITIVLPEPSCSNDETSAEGYSASLPAKDKYDSNAAAAAAAGISGRKVQPLQEQRRTCSPKDIKIAPIFFRTPRQSKSKVSSDENFLCPRSLQNHLQEKRKRGDESSERVSKRPRWSLTAGMDQCHLSAQGVQENAVLPVKKQPRSSKLSRTHRLKRQSGLHCEPNSEWRNDTETEGQSPVTHDVLHRESSFEDVLWTDKYSPQCSSEVIGNSVSVNKLHSWLKKWKLRAGSNERRKMEERKNEDNSNDSWDCGDFQGEAGAEDDREDPLCNTMLITGPPGVGKTTSVYACAQELGFKVFEVNCSSQRCGRHVLSQLKEATQSHLVETSGKDPLKPAYYSASSCTLKPETVPGKALPPKNVISTSKKRAARNFGRCSRKGKANPATVTLANFFKMKAKADHLQSGGLSPSDKPDSKKLGNPSPGCDQTVPQNKKTATSLILFEEVDVIFDDDVGFLAAIKTFMTTTKRPVILTTNDPLFRERFNCSLEGIMFKTPSAVNVCSYLQLVCLAENVRLELDDVKSLLRLTCGDVRRCLLQLQLWVHSGGGRVSQNGGLTHLTYSNAAEGQDSNLPKCDTGCTASMLGLHPVTQNQLLNLLKCQRWSETDTNNLLRLLAESWRGGVPLLYTNLELLLPISAKGTSVHYLEKETCSELQSELAPSDTDPHFQQLNRNVSPKGAHSRLPSTSDKAEQIAAKVAADCLDALTDFFDLMSYLDATLPAAAPLVSGSRGPEAFVWTGAEVKDGLLDEMSEEEEEEEEGRSWSRERLPDIQAAAEGLGYHRCWWRVSEAWTEAQNYRQELGDKKWERLVERLTSPASSRRQRLRFICQPLCASSVSQMRYELSRTVLSSKSFSLLGNRQAVSVDYVPVLRSICRFHRAQQQKEEPVRCVNYLSSIHLGLSKSTIQLLLEDFS